jgi:hypothetical protein
MIEFTEGIVDRPVRVKSRADRIIATRAFLRGSLEAVRRIDVQTCDATILHAGNDLEHTEDHLNAALYLAGQLVVLLTQARAALDAEKGNPRPVT